MTDDCQSRLYPAGPHARGCVECVHVQSQKLNSSCWLRRVAPRDAGTLPTEHTRRCSRRGRLFGWRGSDDAWGDLRDDAWNRACNSCHTCRARGNRGGEAAGAQPAAGASAAEPSPDLSFPPPPSLAPPLTQTDPPPACTCFPQLEALYALLDDDGSGSLTVHEMIDLFVSSPSDLRPLGPQPHIGE